MSTKMAKAKAPQRQVLGRLRRWSRALVLPSLIIASTPATTLAWTMFRTLGTRRPLLMQKHVFQQALARKTRTRAYVEDDEFGVGRGMPTQQQQQEVEPIAETSRDYTGAGTLGDIMSSSRNTTQFGGLVTSEGGLLEHTFGVRSPLDRMALTANGNLQRLFSSYYDAPVHVIVDKCVRQEQTSTSESVRNGVCQSQTWDRVVHLTVHNQTFCTATSHITVHDPVCEALVEAGTVGIGQLFRYLDKLPNFALLEAGYSPEGGLWRIYELKCGEVSCWIREDFTPNAWQMQPRPNGA